MESHVIISVSPSNTSHPSYKSVHFELTPPISSFLSRAQTCGHSPNSASSALGVSCMQRRCSFKTNPKKVQKVSCGGPNWKSSDNIEIKNHRNRCGAKRIPRSTTRFDRCPYTWLLWCSWLFAEPNQLVFLAASPWFIHTAASSKDSAVVDIALLIVIIIWLLRWVSICSRTTVGSAGETFQIAVWVLLGAVWMETADLQWSWTGSSKCLVSLRRATLTVRVFKVSTVISWRPEKLLLLLALVI